MTDSERRIADRLVAVFRARHPELAWKVDVIDRSERGTTSTGTAQVVRLEPGTDEPEAVAAPYPHDTDQAA